jgi:hypothetical protein
VESAAVVIGWGNDSRKRFEMAEQQRCDRSVLSSAIPLFVL